VTPRRGEHQRDFPEVQEPYAPPERIGIRLVRVADRSGVTREIVFDPGDFSCVGLAGELADEWVDYIGISKAGGGAAGMYRRAVRGFCRMVDALLADNAQQASLARAQPDIAAALAGWERTLPSEHRAGSMTPAMLASAVRTLIALRAQHEQRPVSTHLRRLVEGEVGVAWGATTEVDEFSRKDKRALVRAAWRSANELQARLDRGWQSAAEGQHPGEHGWATVGNLLWGLANEQIAPTDIRDHLPVIHEWPPQLRSCIQSLDRPVYPARAKAILVRWLVHQLYPSALDLHAFRVLLVAATGHTSEEVTALRKNDVEFLPTGVRLSLTKQRARRFRHRVFTDQASADTASGQEVDFADRAHRDVTTIIRRLMDATEQARLRIPDSSYLFAAASVTGGYELRFMRWGGNKPGTRFADWLVGAGLQVEGNADIRRLRKSTKVEKAIAFSGRIAEAANDHHEETFRGHYAQGTTLRVLSGKVIATAQDHWFRRAVEGPTVLSASTAELLEQPGALGSLGLSTQEADDLRQGPSTWVSPVAVTPTTLRSARRDNCVLSRRCGAWNAATPGYCPAICRRCCCSPSTSIACAPGSHRSISRLCGAKPMSTSRASSLNAPMKRKHWPASILTPERPCSTCH
jgi:hypothetical protein